MVWFKVAVELVHGGGGEGRCNCLVIIFLVDLKFHYTIHNLHGTSQLDSQAFDEGLVSQEQKRYSIYLLGLKQVHVVIAI